MADGYFAALRRGAGELRDQGERARDGAETLGRRAAHDLREHADDARGELTRLWGQLEELVERRLGPAASEGYRVARQAGRQGRDTAIDLADRLRDVTRDRPLLAIGVAVAATWAIASMLRSRR